ncbi:MAG: hypothetical protein R3F59_23000 [Myxococcota bacterium]
MARGWQLLILAALAAGCEDGPVKKVGDGLTLEGPGTVDTGGATTEPLASCDARDQDGTCTDFVGPDWDQASIQNACIGAVNTTACPVADIGGCSYEAGGPLASIVWYYTGNYYGAADETSLSADCYQTYGAWL